MEIDTNSPARNNSPPKHSLFLIAAALAEAIIIQLIATVGVYTSNKAVYEKMTAIDKAGYLAIPNPLVWPKLQSLSTAFYGGLFFSLTCGLTLCIISFAAGCLWHRFFGRDKKVLGIYIVIWLFCFYLINRNGISFLANAYFLFIPTSVFMAAIYTSRIFHNRFQRQWIIPHLAVFILMVIFGVTQFNSLMFSRIRDRVLLVHPIGVKLNNFYYTYTLYPAEVFKSLYQKELRTVKLSTDRADAQFKRLKLYLLSYDYLVLDDDGPIDLDLKKENDTLVFTQRGRFVIATKIDAFFKRPGKILKSFSDQTDRHVFFRGFTFISLLTSTLVVMYLALFLPLRFITGFFLRASIADWSAAFLCCVTVLTPLYILQNHKGQPMKKIEDIPSMLASDHLDDRLGALEKINDKRLEITSFDGWEKIAESPHIPERIRLANALSKSRDDAAFDQFLKLLDDPQINVAYYSYMLLNKMRYRNPVNIILQRIGEIDKWYVQLKAYQTLRKLGWRQTESK